MTRLMPGMAFVLIGFLGLAGGEPGDPEPKKDTGKKGEEVRPLSALWSKDPPLRDTDTKPPATPAPNRVQMVNTRNLRLSYDLFDLGKSDIGRVEVWATNDTTVWRKLTEQPPSNPPSLAVQVGHEARWGFKLIAVPTIGRAEPAPERGHQPDFWVEVDETSPSVILHAPEVTGDRENGQVTIRWTADDRHLAERPISIHYSSDGQKWVPIASGIANEGRYVWSIPVDLPHPQCFIRVEAVDQAGNVGTVQTATPVVTDLAIPRVRIKTVQATGRPPSHTAGAPMSGLPGTSGIGIVPVTGIEPVSPATLPANTVSPMMPPPGILAPPR